MLIEKKTWKYKRVVEERNNLRSADAIVLTSECIREAPLRIIEELLDLRIDLQMNIKKTTITFSDHALG